MLDQRWLNNIKAPQCENTMEDDEALSDIYGKGFLSKYKCPKRLVLNLAIWYYLVLFGAIRYYLALLSAI